ncbi:DUF4231 domain-containing protein [Streptomyces sp. NPDC060085]|uniref:DUF4231 domain-containing protein n=1 Tax=Streptomyces sp. NPDC060085 TaxID=3347054 RepID=UPI0036694A9F
MSEGGDFDRGDLPSIYRAASESAQRGQDLLLRLTKWRLRFVVLAALAGVLYSVEALETLLQRSFAALSLALFLGALASEVLLLNERPDKAWYSGRALAESIKTLSWRFMVCAEPFPKIMPLVEAERSFRVALREILSLHPVRLVPEESPQITEKMEAVRASNLDCRMRFYMQHRIIAQQRWYSEGARVAERKSWRWKRCLIGLEVAGAGGALFVLMGFGFPDFGGVLAAVIAGCVAWVEVRQFDSLAEAYSLTAAELALIHDSGSAVETEEVWSRYVVSAEQGISREHTMWLARRSFH